MPTLRSEEEMDAMDYVDDSDDDPVFTKILEDIRDGSQSHPNLIGEKHIIKCVIVLGKNNWNGKER